MANIALFFGSFNPIHIAHLAIANYVCEFEEIDELWFVISPQNPFKSPRDLLENSIRLSFVNRAIIGYSKFRACDIEFGMPKPSYTIDTLDKLKKEFPKHQFSILIGSDNWAIFHEWKEYERILAEHTLLIYPRKGFECVEENQKRVKWIPAPLMDISSTFIRKSLIMGKDVRYFLPASVYKMIKEDQIERYWRKS